MLLPDIELTITDKGKSLLTGRERQVLLGDADGKTDKQMAKELGISPGAIAIYQRRIYGKLKVRQDSIDHHIALINARSAALVRAIAYGLLSVALTGSGYDY